jgi:xanthine dehydrogenase accessory factor
MKIRREDEKMTIGHIVVLIRGGGDIASGVAHRLSRCRFKVCMTEVARPLAVRREVSFSEAVFEREKTVDGLTARLIESCDQIPEIWNAGMLPIMIDPEAAVKDCLKPYVLIDAILAKRNVGTRITDAPLVMGLGPGFRAGTDVHLVVETKRGHDLGRVISEGEAERDTGIPAEILGFSVERVLRASRPGRLRCLKGIGDYVDPGDIVALVDDAPIKAHIKGIIRGLLRDGSEVYEGMKTGDVDPRGIREFCYSISDKARAIGGGVLEGIVSYLNRSEAPSYEPF